MHTILHLGLGSFHRAHQAVYVHQLRQQGDTRWSITGGNLRPDMADTIAANANQSLCLQFIQQRPAGNLANQLTEARLLPQVHIPGDSRVDLRGSLAVAEGHYL